ncbi:MAG: signaling protein [Frankiales bacterium]|nr:signaling protein [Frankiales bacterium]
MAGQPPAGSGRILLLVLVADAILAHVPGFLPAAVASSTALVLLAGLWASSLAGYAWVLLGAIAMLPVPPTAAAGVVTVAAAAINVGVLRLVRSLVGLIHQAQTSVLRQYGERDQLARESRVQREELAGQVEYLASHDQLTDVLNRSALTRHLTELAGSGTPTGVLVVAAAGFTTINDELGPDVGDEMLAALARRLRGRARESDLVARLGGDEFAVVLPGLTGEHARLVADRLAEVLTDPFTVGPHVVSLHARCGLALDDGSFAKGGVELLRQASSAASSAKPDTAPAIFSASSRASVQESRALEADLHRALENDEFFLLYQPLISVETGRIESVEALVRWQHPQRGLVPPDAFIGAAERSGQIVPLGLRVLEMALAQLREWSSGTAPSLTVAVNVSARQLVEPDFVAHVQAVLWSAGVDPRQVRLELTESMLVEDGEAAIAALWQLRRLGVRLAIDDFGTGYSSLARIGELPIDEMKIDKSFVDRLGVAPHDSTALVTAAIAMGHGLGLEVVAEGVETQMQATQLAALGCDLLQGYLLGRPQAPDAVTPQLGRRLLADQSQIPAPRPEPAANQPFVPQVVPDDRSACG